MDSCYFISSWLIVQKTFLIKMNHLSCDSTTEVPTTLNNDYKYKYPNTQNLTVSRANIDIQKKEVSQIRCHDQDKSCHMVEFKIEDRH